MKFQESKEIKQYILNRVSEITIFSYYLQIPASDINESIAKTNKKIKNVWRGEKDPSIRFEYNSQSKLRMIDYGSKLWTGDCFHIAGVVLNRNSNNPIDFKYILNDIIQNLLNDNTNYIPIDKPIISIKENKIKKIDILTQSFSKFDFNFFSQFHIRNNSIKNTFVVQNYWIDNVQNIYEYSEKDPCYAYFIDKLNDQILWKLYFPFRKKTRFLTNNPISIEGLQQLKDNDYLIITKSRKDKMLLDQIFIDLNISNVDVVALHSESIYVPDNIIKYLKSKYKEIFSIFDNDKAGIECTQNFASNYAIYPYLFGGKSHENLSKDVTDTAKDYGYKHILTIIRTNYINLINKT